LCAAPLQAASGAKILAANLRVLHRLRSLRREETPTARRAPPSPPAPPTPRAPGEGPTGSERRFFLAGTPRGTRAQLLADEEHHAISVLRIRAGETLLGLDGEGRSWPLRVAGVARRSMELEVTGPPRVEPPAGDPEAPLPWIEFCVSLPRAGRAEDMLDRLVQLGIAALAPLVCERSQTGARELTESRLARLDRAAREACKQSRRSWKLVLGARLTPETLGARARASGAELIALSPGAGTRLVDRALELRAQGAWPTRDRPLILAIGPEGGFTAEEVALLRAAGARELCLAPHILRTETAAEAAAALVAQVFFEPARAQNAMRSRSET
jgi:16S rRNA (uracil1498-N3)-methyltransferase